MLADDMQVILEDPLPPNVRKVLDLAEEEGWSYNPVVSLVVRLTKPDDPPRPGDSPALPFYAMWILDQSREGKRSWRFKNARAKNGQAMNFNDILTYLQDPAVIYPLPPDEREMPPGEPCYCDYYSFKPHEHVEPADRA